jgi:hypothetical protein
MTRLTPFVLVGFVASVGPAVALEPAKLVPPEPTITFSFDKKKWGEVIDWFRTESGLVFAGSIVPTGSITIAPPPGKKYSVPQVVDLLNELLAPRFVLIRRDQTFTILPADEPIEPLNVKQISDVAELVDFGKTEIVQLVIPLGPVPIEEVGPSVKLLFSSFGKASPFGATAVVVQDKAANVRRIAAAIAKLGADLDSQERYAHPCKYVRAAAAADTLKTLLGSDAAFVEPANPNLPTGARYDRPAAPRKTVRISVQEAANVVLVTGPPDKVSAAKKFLRDDIDRGTPGTELPVGEAKFQTYAVAPGTAETVASTLTARFKNSSVAVFAVGTDRVHVFGYPADHAVIAKQVLSEDPNGRGDPITEIVELVDSDAKSMAARMTRMFPPTNGLPFVDAQYDGPKTGVLVRGTPDQVKRIRKEITDIDNPTGLDSSVPGNRRTVHLPSGSGILAECLADFITRTSNNNVIILDPVNPPERPKVAAKPVRKRTPPVEWSNPMPPAGTWTDPASAPQTPDGVDPRMAPGLPRK